MMEFAIGVVCGVVLYAATQYILRIKAERKQRNRFVQSKREAPQVPTRNRVRTQNTAAHKARISRPSVRGKYRSRL